MNNKQAYDQFYNSFIVPQREQSPQDFQSLLLINRQDIISDFETILIEVVSKAYEFQQTQNNVVLHSCECAILISALLTEAPFIIAEIFGQEWYHSLLTQSIGMCSIFFAYWSQLRDDAKKEARQYMGKIHEETVDREMIAWLMLNTRYLFPYFQEAVTNIKQKKEKNDIIKG